MAWNEMKYRIIEIKRGLGNPFEVKPEQFNSIEEAVDNLKKYKPMQQQQCITVPMISYIPEKR